MAEITKIGDAEVHWNGRQFFLIVKKNMEKNLRTIASHTAGIARRLAPVGSLKYRSAADKYGYTKIWKHRSPGKLRRSIKAKKSKYKDGGWVVVVSERAYYARWVEYGRPSSASTRIPHMKAQPFLTPAIRKAQGKINREIQKWQLLPGDNELVF